MMTKNSIRKLIKEMIEDVLIENNAPDSNYTYWTPSDISYLKGTGMEYDDEDDSFYKEFLRGSVILHVQKRKKSSYMIKVIDYNGGKTNITFNTVARTQEEMMASLQKAAASI
jgi:hypothetical protein